MRLNSSITNENPVKLADPRERKHGDRERQIEGLEFKNFQIPRI